MADRPKLAALADRVGIMPDYVNHNGTERRFTSNDTRLSLLEAMGFDASLEQTAQAAIDSLDHTQRQRIIDPVRVVQVTDGEAETVTLRLPRGANTSWDWDVELHEESGRVHRVEGRQSAPTPLSVGANDHRAQHSNIETMELPLPARPELGYHRVRVILRASNSE